MACFKLSAPGLFGLGALAICVALTGCDQNKPSATTALADDHTSVVNQEEMETRLRDLGAQMQRERDRADALATQLAACQEGTAPPPAETTADASQFSGIPGVEATAVGGEIHLAIASSLLFDSGKTSLKDTSKKSLDQVASKLKELYPNRQILVVGHTDADPIRKSTYATNYHLGFERAFRVREYLGKKGLPDGQMALVSYGPDHPQSTKERSRRVEIVVTDGEAVAKAGKSEKPRNAATAATKNAAPAKTTAAKKAPAGKKTSAPSK